MQQVPNLKLVANSYVSNSEYQNAPIPPNSRF
jgi:hypothetical protein